MVKLRVSKFPLRTMSGGGQVISGRILRLRILIDLRAVVLNRGQLYPLPPPLRGDIWQCLERFLVVTTGAGELLVSSG